MPELDLGNESIARGSYRSICGSSVRCRSRDRSSVRYSRVIYGVCVCVCVRSDGSCVCVGSGHNYSRFRQQRRVRRLRP